VTLRPLDDGTPHTSAGEPSFLYQIECHLYWQKQLARTDSIRRQFSENFTIEGLPDGMRYQSRPGSRVVTSWTIHALSSGSLNEKKDP
jgi:hypothetical protein